LQLTCNVADGRQAHNLGGQTGKRAIGHPEIFKIMFSCWVQQQQVTFCAPKDSSWLQPVALL